MIERLVSFWECLFFGAMLNFGDVMHIYLALLNIAQACPPFFEEHGYGFC